MVVNQEKGIILENREQGYVNTPNNAYDIWIRTLGGNAWIIWQTLRRFCPGQETKPFPNVRMIDWAMFLGMGIDKFKANLKILEEVGIVEIKYPRGQARLLHKPVRYIINPAPMEIPASLLKTITPFPDDCKFADPIFSNKTWMKSMFKSHSCATENPECGVGENPESAIIENPESNIAIQSNSNTDNNKNKIYKKVFGDEENINTSKKEKIKTLPRKEQPTADSNKIKNTLQEKNENLKKEKTENIPLPYLELFPREWQRESKFRIAWAEWAQHKKEIKKLFTELSATKLRNKLLAWGLVRAIKAIDHSIEKGWTGVFEETQQSKQQDRPNSGPYYRDRDVADKFDVQSKELK